MTLKVSRSLWLWAEAVENSGGSLIEECQDEAVCQRGSQAGKGGLPLPARGTLVCARPLRGCCQYVAKCDQFLEPPQTELETCAQAHDPR